MEQALDSYVAQVLRHRLVIRQSYMTVHEYSNLHYVQQFFFSANKEQIDTNHSVVATK